MTISRYLTPLLKASTRPAATGAPLSSIRLTHVVASVRTGAAPAEDAAPEALAAGLKLQLAPGGVNVALHGQASEAGQLAAEPASKSTRFRSTIFKSYIPESYCQASTLSFISQLLRWLRAGVSVAARCQMH